MNLPNKLTCMRVILIPFFVGVMMYAQKMLANSISADSMEATAAFLGRYGTFRLTACAIFCAAAFTDFLDGYLARKYHLITNFGKFMDPLADKLLVCTALILLTAYGQLPVWATIIIIAREFIISGFRLVASDNGIVIAASWWGKWKTVCQMAMCILMIGRFSDSPVYRGAETVLMYAAVILTVVSLIDYIRKNSRVITEGGM
ncbi:MAG: CDP-diacylglycerol--glycerol-3-phosphate 3-phosphatidyltransferase [Eubacteriales bacterium]|nr:CDP-diacylglycerol--glycerol-3-phosphate 3-phosphatidyltransferase [Eubacteriales bacterium]